MCESSNMGLYDRDTYECKDCGHLVNKERYHYKRLDHEHQTRRGKCKIIDSKNTNLIYGTNSSMTDLVGNGKIYSYRTKWQKDNNGRFGVAYDVKGWVWSPDDLMIVDDNGNEIEEFPLPEPEKFDSNFLYL